MKFVLTGQYRHSGGLCRYPRRLYNPSIRWNKQKTEEIAEITTLKKNKTGNRYVQ